MSNNTVSGWQKAQTVAACLQVVVVSCSLLIIFSQLNQQKRQLEQQTVQLNQQVKLNRAANTQALVDLITPLNLKLTDRGMAELWVKGHEGINKVSDPTEREIQKQQYENLVASYMVFYENAYSQYRAGLLDEEIYNGWDKDLGAFISTHKFAEHWHKRKDLYRKDFSDHVYEIIASQKSATPN